ncbi:MAG: hypothetical protein VKJ09_12485 [Leptolyngbya sp.]|nr:hypothetical protein [Leptolyngbya sp.]
MVYASAVLPLDSHVLPGLNQETYQALQRSLQAIPPHHLWLAACDDIPLQRRLAAGLDRVLLPTAQVGPTSWLAVDPQRPDVAQQIWQRVQAEDFALPYVQILGVEQITRCASEDQAYFLASLRKLAQLWPRIPCSVLLWLPRPWLRQVQRAAKPLAQLSDRTFEFLGDPTPLIDPDGPIQPLPQEWTLDPPRAPGQPSAPPTGKAVKAPTPSAPPAGDVGVGPQTALNRSDPNLEPDGEDSPPTLSASLWQQLEADLQRLEQPAPRKPAPPWEWGRTHGTTLTVPASPATVAQSVALAQGDAEAWAQPLSSLGPSEQETNQRPWVDHAPLFPPVLTEEDVDEIAVPQVPPQLEAEAHPLAGDPGLAEAISPLALAHGLRDRVESGDHCPATLKAAIQQYEQVLAHPPAALQRAEVLNDLGSLYWLLAQETPGATASHTHLSHSKAHYEAALHLPDADLSTDTQVRLHSNLGSVYCLLANHGRADRHLNQAVRAFHRALQHVDPKQDSETYATLQTHLGTAYWGLAQHSATPNVLHRAIAAYQEALIHRPAAVVPLAYAQIQNNLGIAYWSLAQHERPEMLLKAAIAAYQDVLAYRTIGIDPAGHAATQNNLGTAYWDLGRQAAAGSEAQHQWWDQAIAAYGAALGVLSTTPPEQLGNTLSFDPWATHHSLAVVHDHQALGSTDTPEGQRHHWYQAIHHYVAALGGWQQQQSPLAETALQGLIQNLRHQAQALGVEAQQRSLTQIPAQWLPEIWRHL